MNVSIAVMIAVVLLCVGVSVFASTMIFLRLLSRHRSSYEQELKKLESSMNVLMSGSLGMGQKMLVLEERLSQLRTTQDEMKTSDLDFSYSQAQKLIEQGMDSRAIAANSGLSATEIKLMRLLHNHEPDNSRYAQA